MRNNYGHIQRSEKAKNVFMKRSGYPNGRPGYVVDHIIPLYKGGEDTPENMQWLTVEQHKEKHRALSEAD
ncbi:MAG: HNH endonuclease signature motif containing protein [bacterium]